MFAPVATNVDLWKPIAPTLSAPKRRRLLVVAIILGLLVMVLIVMIHYKLLVNVMPLALRVIEDLNILIYFF